jgi:hypothetical protein
MEIRHTLPLPFSLKSSIEAIVQRYQGKGIESRSGYLIVLEIKKPPRGKPSAISCVCDIHGTERWYIVSSWWELKYALEAFDNRPTKLSQEPESFKGFRDKDETSTTPWFFEQ